MSRGDKRLAIMQAVERLCTNRRFHEITTDDIAAEAAVGKGTLYQYFKDKDDLFFQTANSGFDELCDLLRRKVPEEASFDQRLLGACQEIGSFFKRRHHLFRMMHSEDQRMARLRGKFRKQWMEKRQALLYALAEIIRKGIELGQVRDDLPPVVLAGFLLGMLRTRQLDLQDVDCKFRRHEVVVDLFRNGAVNRNGN
jgi:AcrR family transcriptional regulator